MVIFNSYVKLPEGIWAIALTQGTQEPSFREVPVVPDGI